MSNETAREVARTMVLEIRNNLNAELAQYSQLAQSGKDAEAIREELFKTFRIITALDQLEI